ncbi:hypothetical protein AZF37_02580 [endosymbiont 'TC1' of Trimyema compressum]|uniref:F0F1 ATP synthase subunit B n=1 Tax=endosymbiont 'TC1' of Trimyema compressum TaxID=243899 RepID=UPI0007F15EA8|nr:F0F1 ATP synthase subunit B [endosymbiont 'TC1' of Trimyema compressum]AMP20209.1 hypothetical protein AZF37_02580 [endosymbiont 'TC1' of Trimyema compressum]
MESIFQTIHFNPMDFLFQCINILVIIFVLNKFLFKRVGKVIDARKKEIEDNMAGVDSAWQEVKDKEATYTGLMTQAKQKYQTIIDTASKEGEALKQHLQDQAKEEAASMLSQAKKDIQIEKRQALDSIQDEVATLVANGTRAILKKEIDPEMQKDLVNDFVKETGEVNG